MNCKACSSLLSIFSRGLFVDRKIIFLKTYLILPMEASMKKRFCVFIISFIVLVSISEAQVVFVPLDNEVYDFLERMEIKGLTGKCYNMTKPMSRQEVAEYLLHIRQSQKYEELSAVAKDKLNDFISKEYAEEVRRLSRKESEFEPLPEGDSQPEWHPLQFPYTFQYDRSFLAFMPLLRFKYSYNMSDSSFFDKNNQRITGGGEIYGYLGDDIGFYFYGVNNAEKGNSYDIRKLDSPEQGTAWLGTFEDSKSYEQVDAYVSFSTKYIDFIFGRYSNYWTNSATGSLILSNKPPSYTQLMLRTGFSEWLRFTYFHGWLESEILDDELSYSFEWGDGDTLERRFFEKKYVAGHRLEIIPLNNLKFGFSELLYYGERDPEPVYFIPIILFWSAQHYTNDQDNLQIEADVEWIPFDFLKLYGSLMIDEIKLSKIFDKEEARNQLGFQVGAYFVEPFLPGLDFRIEYTRLNPWTYTHKFPINEATSDNYVMGYWTGQNADNLLFGIDYQVNTNLRASLNLERYRKGAQKDIWYQYHTPPSEEFLYGHQYTKNAVGLSIVYDIREHLSCSLGYKFMQCDVVEENIANEDYVNPVLYESDFTRQAISFSIGFGIL
jgi:hypothetical protein